MSKPKRGSPELKPCPFCGRLPWSVITGSGLFHIHCSGGDDFCEISPRTHFYGNQDAAVKAWNERKG